MKLNKFLLITLFTASCAFAQEFKSPVDYLNYIAKEQTTISMSMWKYTSAVAHTKSARRIENIRKQLIKSIQNASEKIAVFKDGYKGDVSFNNQIINYLSLSEKNINEEYGKIIDLQEVADKSYDDMDAYITMRDLINKKMKDEYEKVNQSQKDFAKKYNITIDETETELSKKIKISSEVYDYHTVIYLIFYKVNFTDNNLTKAVEAGNLGSIQQNASSLIQYADEGLAKLQTIQPYLKDASLVNNTKKALEYYKKVATIFAPKVVSYIMYNDKFENAKKTIEAKSKQDRTEEEVNNYNKMVAEMNTQVTNYNNAINNNNQEGTNIINNWNNTSETFISSHVPE